jgi:SAM-dependent methyltransferase
MSAPLNTPKAPNALATNATFEFTALNEAANYRDALVREFAPHLRGCVVEVGAGIGHITALVRGLPGVERVIAVEPEEAFAQHLRSGLPGVEVVQGTAASLDAAVQPDALVSVNVLEHIEQDEAELRRYHELLRPRRGKLCLLVPACPELFAPLDRDFGHFRRYRKAELAGKLTAAGFTVRDLHYYNFAGYFGWWWMFRVRQKRSFDARAVRFFDRWIFPTVNWCETRVTRPGWGQSLIAIASAG